MKTPDPMPNHSAVRRYNRMLLLVAGLGGLLYGVDVGIIAGALPYLQATSGLTANQLSIVVAAVLLGGAISTLFAGALADFLGRKLLMIISGILFVISIPIIAMSHGYTPLLLGRLLQGVSAGLIGVVVPLYLAECLTPEKRGRGTATFQWLLTLGFVTSAGIAMYFSYRVAAVAKLHDPRELFAFKDWAWRSIFWTALLPGILFIGGSFFVAESPRWLFRRGKHDAARGALLRSRSPEQADLEMREMENTRNLEKAQMSRRRESLMQRRYVLPFLLACLILGCTQTTGVNSVIGYNATILIQAGLNDVQAHWGYLLFTSVNFLMTIIGVLLVDRIGRKRLLSIGTAGIIASLVGTGLLFQHVERHRRDCATALTAMIHHQSLQLPFNSTVASKLLRTTGVRNPAALKHPTTLTIIYSYGDFTAATVAARSDHSVAAPISISRSMCVPANGVIAFFNNPFANLEAARKAPLKIDHAWLTPVPSVLNGELTTLTLLGFIAFFAAGPGICVWLALSELMPTRIRSNGMSIALLINQSISAFISAVFLPVVGKYGYATVFFAFAGCTVIYFLAATFLLPETRNKTLEEIETLFSGNRSVPADAPPG